MKIILSVVLNFSKLLTVMHYLMKYKFSVYFMLEKKINNFTAYFFNSFVSGKPIWNGLSGLKVLYLFLINNNVIKYICCFNILYMYEQ